MRAAGTLSFALGVASLATLSPGRARETTGAKTCPPDMARVRNFCVDRYEAHMVDAETGQPLSPYYPPTPRAAESVHFEWQLERTRMGSAAARRMPLPELSSFQRKGRYAPKAVSRAGAVPAAYVSYHVARKACASAGKRLCTKDEWTTACRGSRETKFPYGDQFNRSSCNVWGYVHPAFVLHGSSSIGHRDPRLNLLRSDEGGPLLRTTGGTPSCASRWGDDALYDMVGNLDEWVEDETGTFVGGFYARSTTKGCESQVTSHSPVYYDYSTGVRCCKDP